MGISGRPDPTQPSRPAYHIISSTLSSASHPFSHVNPLLAISRFPSPQFTTGEVDIFLGKGGRGKKERKKKGSRLPVTFFFQHFQFFDNPTTAPLNLHPPQSLFHIQYNITHYLVTFPPPTSKVKTFQNRGRIAEKRGCIGV